MGLPSPFWRLGALSIFLLPLALCAQLHEWRFDEPAGVRLGHTDNLRDPFTNWTVSWADSATTGDGTFRIRRNGSTWNSRIDIGPTGGADMVYVTTTLAGWDFRYTTGSRPYMRFSFMNGPASATPSDVTAEAVLRYTASGTVTLEASAGGTGGTSSAAQTLFTGGRQSEPFTISVGYSAARNQYAVHYRIAGNPWLTLFSGNTSSSRSAPSYRMLIANDFAGNGNNFADIEEVVVSTTSPVTAPAAILLLNSEREEVGTTWAVGPHELVVGAGAGQEGVVRVSGGGLVSGFATLRLGSHSASARGRVIISDPGSRLLGGVRAPVVLGDPGQGSLEVADGGSFQAGPLFAGEASGAQATIEIRSAGSSWSGDGEAVHLGRAAGSITTAWIHEEARATDILRLQVGGLGDAELHLNSGGRLEVIHSVEVGSGPGGRGLLAVSGQNSGASLGSHLRIGVDAGLRPAGADAQVSITDHGQVLLGGQVQIRNGGTLHLASGGRLVAARGLDLGAPGQGGRLTLDGGHLVVADTLDMTGIGELIWTAGSLEATGLVTGLTTIPEGRTLRLSGPDGWIANPGGTPLILEPGSAIEGDGAIASPVDLGSAGTTALRGDTGARLRLLTRVSGAGMLDRVRINGVIAPDPDGPGITLGDVEFGGESTVSLNITARDRFGRINVGDSAKLGGARLEVHFDGFSPAPTDSFALISHTGTARGPHAFAVHDLPAGWELAGGTLVFTGAPSTATYADWAAAHGLAGVGAEPEADPDGDGVSNLAKFRLGGIPNTGGASLLQPFAAEGGAVFRWRKRVAGDTAFIWESSADLLEWTRLADGPAPRVTPLAEAAGSGYAWSEVVMPVTEEQRFHRLRAEPAPTPPVFPSATWEMMPDPEAEGIPSEAIAASLARAQSLDTTAYMAVKGGRVIFSYGDLAFLSYSASVRKSFLSMLYGRYVDSGEIRLDESLAEIGINDRLGLLPIELTATVHDLLRARSGVYHPRSNTGDSWASAPPRGSVVPGTYNLYNNWDFNALGTILTVKTGKNPYEAMLSDLARPLQMEDYSLEHQSFGGDYSLSVHLAYYYTMSTRDMARLGYLMLRRGNWNGEQVIPEWWVDHSLHLWTPAIERNPASARTSGIGYSYLWWIREVPESSPYYGSYAAHGAGGQYVMVVPRLDLVLAHKTNSSGTSLSVSRTQFYAMADILVEAMWERHLAQSD